ncbi:NADH-flavin reductase [Neobacillus piezotolerans]|uniref:NADH-flavin reductase n=1 Tax=Neobacillus piezotolerans TaxID=2259171 RepID=A0A3D8GW60_9BACI|nr:NAD(P)H-binding protein [Neobacillus piezotolerans]RDU38694.1 NADH-flavin reductase [Neobacillus piezotolerans]
MKIIVFGATGNTGKRVLALGVKKGHEMTAFVRSPEKLYEQQGEQIARQVMIVNHNIMDPQSVYEALSHQDAAVIAAGNVGNGEEFIRIVDNIVTQCEDHPLFSGRVWLMGGAGLLEIPHTNIMGNDLPGSPPIFQYHNQNLNRLKQTKLDWSIMCPGTMMDATEESKPEHLYITADILPLPFSEAVREFSEAELAGHVFSRIQELDVAYEDVANCMLNNLEVEGPFKGKRVGIVYRREM